MGTHIGGHTRSVHSRHDKAEKQWTDMATKLGRGYGQRPKEKVKVRTKEFERLLISIEDAEGHTDRHNMLVFLMQDILKKEPVGFEKIRRNLFDPEDDESSESDAGSDSDGESPAESPKKDEENRKRREEAQETVKTLAREFLKKNGKSKEKNSKTERAICVRKGCTKPARFDSIFCSD